jgi:hypothetical protein
MKKIIILIISLLSVMSWQSCQYDWVVPEEVIVPDVVSFSADIIPIFDRGCNMSGCHSVGGFAPDLTPANAYADLFAENQIDLNTPKNSILYRKIIQGGSMYIYTQPGDADIILKWIEDGALDN